MKKVAEVPPAGPDLATPISPSSYAAPARSRARRALTVGLMILLLVAALVAVWYISRARAMRSVPASPVKARLESPLPDRDSAHSVVDKAR
jgi:type VI protein secretion system component VasF